jgi:hypothetical protein
MHVPEAFGPGSFDNAERSIKELVLTNTWPKFVNAGYANSMQKPTLGERLDSCKEGLQTCGLRVGNLWGTGVKKIAGKRG